MQELTINNDKASVYTIRCYENIARFLILSYHEAFQNQQFDKTQNTERLTDCLS